MTRNGGIFPVFHPVRATDNNYALLYLIFDPLVKLASDETTVLPNLAESWTQSDDAKTFTLKLADGITFSDGTPLTADDVVFTATWAAQNASAFQGFPSNWVEIDGAADIDGTTNPLKGIVATDPHTVQITLANPNVDFIRLLADSPNVILPKHVYESTTGATIEQSDLATKSPIGSGPYTLTNFQPDQFAELQANPNYFAGAPKIDKIAWKVLDSAQILSQLQTGELDFAMKVNAKDQALLSSNPDLEFPTTTDVGMYGLFLRTDSPVLDDPKIRQAMYYAIDRQSIIDGILNGQASLLWNPPGLNYDTLNKYPFDPEKSKQLLAEAGYAGEPLKMVYWKDASNASEYLPVIQQQLKDVGLNVELQPLELEDWDDMVTNPDRRGEWDIELDFGGQYGLGPAKSSRAYGTCEGPKVQTGYQNCDLAKLFADARGTADPTARQAIYDQIGQIINDAADVIYLWQTHDIHPMTKRLTGVDLHPFERYSAMSAKDWQLAPK